MHRRTFWPGTTFWSICFLCQGICQIGLSQGTTTEVPDPRTYLAFFREVTALKSDSDGVLVNGVVTTIKRVTVQEAIGLTDPETQILNTRAEDCEAKIRSIDGAVRALTFEARLRSIQSEGAPEPLGQWLRGLENQRDEIVREQIQQLKSELGASRFEILDAYVRSKKSETFFPPVGPVPMVRRK